MPYVCLVPTLDTLVLCSQKPHCKGHGSFIYHPSVGFEAA